MPHASWPMRDLLAWLVTEPKWLDLFVHLFTAAELAVGLMLALGLLSRLTGVAVVGLGLGLMHTSGWMGPTCLSEWHTASLLSLTGLMLALSGAGSVSLDRVLEHRFPKLGESCLWSWGARPRSPLDVHEMPTTRGTLLLAATLLVYVMGMNQAFHGGVWGPLHNHTTVPGLIVGAPSATDNGLRFSLYRDRGPETWGAHVVNVRWISSGGTVQHSWHVDALRALDSARIHNHNVNAIRVGAHALEVPLGAEAMIDLPLPSSADPHALRGSFVEVEEVGGLVFRSEMAQSSP